MSYCAYIRTLKDDQASEHRIYHDTEYGFPLGTDDELFERLVLEINQAGLSWTTILKKKEHFRKAYHGFSIRKVAGYKQKDIDRLLNDSGVIRNRLKIEAAIHNANVILSIQKENGSFSEWLDSHHPKSREEWTKLFKKTFRFTGGEIVNEFLLSTGYLPGAHDANCPVHKKITRLKPRWMSSKGKRAKKAME
ncbi:DNA-3-methyladenine glycosylase I [Leptospira fluminis]|uniref:DNA-3-methyladenine glycosylase I n=1 Tax=Leptospira fluminis TaxID=2484979 RepID=A0A4R9GS73_9LEPT|nr:DNA-3-methyladenine glycosylase I [Leptospira fluminis]TGK21062.1 DNA-3-methyladenine glycosylase I [Leptospira fluminis]